MWDHFVLGHPQASGYHTLAWRGVISTVFGHRTFYLMAKDEGGTILGVLPMVLTKSPMFGCFLTSMAFLNYGGVLADRSDVRLALLAAAGDTARGVGAAHIELRQTEPIETDWPVRSRKVSMRLALPPDYETLFKAYPSKLRSQIRRAQKEGMDVRVGGEELLEDYYRVFARCMRDLGTPVYEKGFFRSIVETFSKEVRLCVVSLKGMPLASGLLYGFRSTLEIPWAASDKRFSRLAPNMLLYSAVLEFACREGFKEFDFGRSSADSGTYRFKQQWGAHPRQLHWYYWLSGGQSVPELNPDNPKFKAAISVWQHLPLPVANTIGPHIVKYLP
ncbi:MAG: FemAB family PEP-CTERM system-associated protein [Nitrospiraceae bacterium]|nr:FemAB family PEP-CTERM system-associated protein [Nitrospiraceae bacterium]